MFAVIVALFLYSSGDKIPLKAELFFSEELSRKLYDCNPYNVYFFNSGVLAVNGSGAINEKYVTSIWMKFVSEYSGFQIYYSSGQGKSPQHFLEHEFIAFKQGESIVLKYVLLKDRKKAAMMSDDDFRKIFLNPAFEKKKNHYDDSLMLIREIIDILAEVE